MEPHLREAVRIARRWWWLLLLGPLLMGGVAYGVTTVQTPRYAAQVTLQVSPVRDAGISDYNALLFAERMTQTYQRLITLRPVLMAVIDELDLPMDFEELRDRVTAQADGESQLLVVRVSDPDPVLAATIANTLAAQFTRFVVAQATINDTIGNGAVPEATSETELQAQFDTLDQRLVELADQVAALEDEPGSDGVAIQEQIALLERTIADLQPLHEQLQLALEGARAGLVVADARITVAETAIPPEAPYAPRLVLNIMLGLALGLLLAGVVIGVRVVVAPTVASDSDVLAWTGAPMLAEITTMARPGHGRQQLFVIEEPAGVAAEATRLLRTNLEFASAAEEIVTFAISSPQPGEGKSTVAANLAVTLANAGFVTALVDADLRHATLHRIFETGNDRGLSTLLQHPQLSWQQAVVETGVPNLCLIPSGPPPPQSADVLGRSRLADVLNDMKRTVDVVVLDTPPVLTSGDAHAVAAHVDGVVLVWRTGYTRPDALRRAAMMLQQGAVRTIGVIVNHQQEKAGRFWASARAPQHDMESLSDPVASGTRRFPSTANPWFRTTMSRLK